MAETSPRTSEFSRVATKVLDRVNASNALSGDPKFKKYTQQVDKCLATFDSIHEWADFIAFLTKLLKTLQSFMQFKEIPQKLWVGKRLAQCMNPALPTGVHQRALDVYSHILAVIGPEGLKRDLQIWSPGLFPFLTYSATSVRPALLNIYDTHYLALKSGLHPITKAFILALLPGLEEENGEFFDKVMNILDRLSETVTQAFFLQNLWLVLLTAPTARGTAVAYLSRRFPKLKDQADVTSIVGRDVGLMVRAFAASLEDDDNLVRRGILELLTQSFKLDSQPFKQTHADDQQTLMKAASGVVLRKDLSLSRRLYSWLLGTAESSEEQIKYLRQHGLELLRNTLRVEMSASSSGVPDPRPYKIFISLLDKWEIGLPLTEVLIIDSVNAVQSHLKHEPLLSDGDLIMTASELYKVIEPIALWKPLFASSMAELLGERTGTGAMQTISFVLRVFKSHDEETLRVHLPLIFTALCDLLDIILAGDSERVRSDPVVFEAIHLLEAILPHLSSGVLTRPLEIRTDSEQETPVQASPLMRAMTLYKVQTQIPLESLHQNKANAIPLAVAFESLVRISLACAKHPAPGQVLFANARECLLGVLSILMELVGRLDDRHQVEGELIWGPIQWLIAMEDVLHENSTFEVVDKAISTFVKVSSSQFIRPRLVIDHRRAISKMVLVLLAFLRPQWVPYHVRAVQLIWALEASERHGHVEAAIAASILDHDGRPQLAAIDAFGVLWRLTDDSLLPGFHFKTPMMIVLDSLRSNDPNHRRVGETWMRCCLKSYLRVLDPLLFDLVDPDIIRASSVTTFNGRDTRGYTYQRSIDERRIQHLLETLLSVVKFGGQGFSRVVRTTLLQNSSSSSLSVRSREASVAHDGSMYMDVLIEVLLRFVLSEPKKTGTSSVPIANIQVQSSALDLLQAVVTKGDVDPLTLDNVEAAIIGKLYVSVHSERMELQNKLLHVLHSVIIASTGNDPAKPEHNSRFDRTQTGGAFAGESGEQFLNSPISSKVNPLLVHTLVDGISKATNRPVLQHWVDFILMTIPRFQQSANNLIFPLSDATCRQLRVGLEDLVRTYADSQATANIRSFTTDSDLIALFNALERLVLLGLTKSENGSTEDDTASVQEKVAVESGGLLGLVSNVFSSDSASVQEEHLVTRSPSYYCLDEAVRVLYAIWIMTQPLPRDASSPISETQSLVFSRVRLRCRKVLERLFRAQSAEVLESLVECWNRGDDIIRPSLKSAGTFEIVDLLASSAQTVVHMLCESISYRITPAGERSRRMAINPNLPDTTIFSFLEEYIGRLEGPIAVQVWSRYVALTKEISSNVYLYKRQVYPALRCFVCLSEKVAQTTAAEDRRTRKEMQDNFTKLADTCVLIAGRSFDQGNWIRRGPKDVGGLGERSTTPIPRMHSDAALNEKPDGASIPAEDSQRSLSGPDLIDQINEFLGAKLLPNLRRLLADSDKVLALCNNIVYYIVAPSMKTKSRTLDVERPIMDIMAEMVKIPAALKAWRAPISEAFTDTRFFNANPASSPRWRLLVKTLMESDKTVIAELIGKITAAPSANIFANREYEMLLRSLNLRRLSYALFAGERNQYLGQLPAIQEKLVDLLRNPTLAPVVLSEVYLCMRVLLCRLSPHNMNSFWPVILTEMFRVFEQCIGSPPADGSEDLMVILAACKFLDLVLVLQTEEFQTHQWMFVTDTVDAVYRPEAWIPEAVMDQLAEIVVDLPDLREHSEHGDNVMVGAALVSSVMERAGSGLTNGTSPSTSTLRRPLLSSIRSIDSIKDLVPFFSHVSLFSYESVYSSAVTAVGSSIGGPLAGSGAVDWEAVEKGLIEEMFEGR